MLPIHQVIEPLKAALAAQAQAVLVAPPGAGKTTVIPLALMDEPWVQGRRIVVLEPRRLAARAAAHRMAHTLNERVGERVGFRVRMQSVVSARTRVEVVTEGVFTRMILDDPGLDGVAAVVFDEFHERSLEADLGLALARDAQSLLRPDLRLLVMSATLDAEPVAALLDLAPVLRSEGRAFPVETRYLGRDPSARLEDLAAKAVRRALAEETGSLLVFLPGQGEIRRTAERLADRLPPDAELAPLYGALDLAVQDRAIEPAPAGRRKVVLATSIAETSLTIEGVRVVVDTGWSRVPRYDPASGLTRLETVRVSRSAAEQRRGRAGRTEPGVCYRLWDEREDRSLPAAQRAEILEADLSGFALSLARWGARDASGLAFLDPAPMAAMDEALALLHRLGALDPKGTLTQHGELLSRLPLPPRLAHMVSVGAAHGLGERAAQIAALLSERGLGGGSTALHDRLAAFAADRSPRAREARALAARWASTVPHRRRDGIGDALLLASAFPERVAQARGKPGEFRLATGRGAYLDPHDPLAREAWLAVGELGGGEARDRILLAEPVGPDELEKAFADQIENEDLLDLSSQGRVRVRRVRRLGALVLDERPIERPPAEVVEKALLDQVQRHGLDSLPWGEGAKSLRARVAFLRSLQPDLWPDLSDEGLAASLDDWLAPILHGRESLSDLAPATIEEAVRALIPWDRQRELDRLAPPRFAAPTGSTSAIDYAAEGGPRVEVRVQELFGLDRHPTVADGAAALTLVLLSPARRPVQLTRDLPGFWRGSWSDVRADMKGRYPKHPWPDDPLSAAPTTRAKPRGT